MLARREHELGEEPGCLLQSDTKLHPGQVGPETAMGARTEGQMSVW
jgi:hypothetical protein